MTIFIKPSATATIDGDAYELSRGSTVRLDGVAVPYASATLQLPMLAEAALDALNPLDFARVSFEHGVAGTPARTFDLAVKRREANHKDKTVTLALASDELLLQKYRALVPDGGSRAHEASCRAVVNYVLARIGATLEPGADDADVTAFWSITNMLPNPSLETNLNSWIAGLGATSLTRADATGGTTGGFGIRWVASGGIANIVPVPTRTSIGVSSGRSYVWTFFVRGSDVRNVRAHIQWFTQGGQLVGESIGAVVTSPVTGYKRVHVIATAPESAKYANPFIGTTGNAPGNAYIADGGMFYEGDELVPYFDGSTADDSSYTYDWAGAAHESPSIRRPVVERLPELFTWQPGMNAWDFLVAITASVGLVLWCDEQRKWRLSSPENRTIVSLVVVTEGNTREGADSIDLDDDDTTPTGVVVKFTWTDTAGARREEYDHAGTPERAILVELPERAYPGPGMAAAILARRQGTGRRQDVDTVTQVAVTPGMTAQISLPAAPDTVGRVSSVEFDLTDGFMALGMAGLVDIIPGSVAALVGPVDGLVGTVASL